MAAARDDILEAILKPPTILRFLFRLAASKETPRNILEETLLCLITLAEDNLELGQAVINDPETHCYDVLVKYTAGSDMIAALTCGLLHNIFTSLQWHDYSPGKDGASDARLVPVLSRILEQTTFPTGTLNGHEGSGPTETLQAALEVVATIATDFQGVLENGNRAQKQGATSEEWNGFVDEEGNAAAAADAVDGIDEMDIDSEAVGSGPDGDDNEEVDIDEDMTQVTGTGDQPEESTGLDDYPTLRELIQRTVPQLLRVCQKAFEGAGEGVMNIQTRALSALNNLAWTISCIDFSNGENPDILKSWTPAADRIWSKVITPILDTDSADLELATVVTGLAWALSRTLAGNTPAKGGEHRKFISLYRASRNPVPAKQSGGGDQQLFDPLQNVTVKCVGVLGQLARDPAPLDRNREVGIFLTTVLASDDVAPADRIEALNQFFDIYGDENAICDKEVFWREGLLKHVEEAAPKFRAMARKIDKRKEQELRMRADEALLNLGRFIKYKKKHAPKEGLV